MEPWSIVVRYDTRLAHPNTWRLNESCDGFVARAAYVPSAEVRVDWRLRWLTSRDEDPDAVPVRRLPGGSWRAGPGHVFPRVEPAFVDLADAPPPIVEALRRL